MEITRKTDYALRMLAMLITSNDGLLSVRTAAEKNLIPYSFARSIQHSLVKAGFVESVRGVNGGMRIKVNPASISIRQVVEAIQGPMLLNECSGEDENCDRSDCCCYHPIWMGAQSLLCNYLDSVTLADIVYQTKFPCVDALYTDPNNFIKYVGCKTNASIVSALTAETANVASRAE